MQVDLEARAITKVVIIAAEVVVVVAMDIDAAVVLVVIEVATVVVIVVEAVIETVSPKSRSVDLSIPLWKRKYVF